ncbi:MAG: GatB/YqeY domain-containing protein [Lachnospiraceae bacterium]|jgi:uncharacterized protein YqeY|nr:GatB/YqeY domain-containing protein [Lachnospiraceae bacterium]MCH4108462.1 GatB/YqeY domain-containing protein [Lachnospiraceae bacterium]MCI1302523.1 GatB/YqeY domain-containing protein [Lachnospiraceae bacterium]MCI1331696.1 GatB/YqeY domain-containing protein [Lachnospiraceae bacterium]MCI1360954.1 GatB/YqeY domain-containing protein [Lachnospiraceae bacterium]
MKLETLQKDMIAAMKAHDKERKMAISSLVSAVKKAGIDAGERDSIPEELVDKAILKELNAVKEEIDTCPASRTDLKEQYEFRYKVIEEYAPKMMSEDEIREVLTTQYADLIASKNKGLIMKTLMPAFKGKAEGKTISKVVAQLLK